jgi:hypothetical protein
VVTGSSSQQHRGIAASVATACVHQRVTAHSDNRALLCFHYCRIVDRAKELARAAVDNMRDTPPPFTVHDANSKHNHSTATSNNSSSKHRHNSSSSSSASAAGGGCVHNGQYYKAGDCSGNCAAGPLHHSSRRKQHEHSDSYSHGEYAATATDPADDAEEDEMVGMSLDDDADCCDDSSTVNSSSHHTAPLSPPEQFRRRRSRSEACHHQQQQLSPSPPPLLSKSSSGGGALRRVSALQGWSDSLDSGSTTAATTTAAAAGASATTAGGSRCSSGSERGGNSSDEDTVGWCTSASRQQARRTGVYRSDVSGDSECASPLGFWAESMSDIDARNKNRPLQPWCDESSGVRSKRGSSSSSASSISSSTTADSSSANGSNTSGTSGSHLNKAKLGGSALRRESAFDDADELQHCSDDERSAEQHQRSNSSAVDEVCEELAALTTVTADTGDTSFNGSAADRWSCSTAEDDSSTTTTATAGSSGSTASALSPAAPVLAPLPRFQGGARDWKQARSYASSCSSAKPVSYTPALQRVQESAPTSSADVAFSSGSSTSSSSAAAGSATSANTGTIDSIVAAGNTAAVQQSAMHGTPADVTTATAATAGGSAVTFSTTTATNSGTTAAGTTVASAVPASLSVPVKFVRSYSYHGLRSEALYDSPARRRSKLTISQRRRQGENSEAFKERFFRFLGVLIQVRYLLLTSNTDAYATMWKLYMSCGYIVLPPLLPAVATVAACVQMVRLSTGCVRDASYCVCGIV